MPSLPSLIKIHPSVSLFTRPWHVIIIALLVGIAIFTFFYGLARKSPAFLLLSCCAFLALCGFLFTLFFLAS